MKRWILGFTVFPIALGVSLIGFHLTTSRNEKIEVPSIDVPTANSVDIATAETSFNPEFTGLPNWDILDFPEFPDNFIDLHNSEGLLRRSEVIGKSGQKWLVMSEVDGKYKVTPGIAKVRQLKSVSYAGDENDAKITFGVSGRPVFAFKHIRNIKQGPVTTVYLRPTNDEINLRNLPIKAMDDGFKRDLNLNENWYSLRVSYGLTTNGEKTGVLVLENNGAQQIVARNYFEMPYGTIIGNLLWAGDIDNDGKLDLYFDEFNEKGYFAGGLYLTSHASADDMVKLVAVFGYAGC